MSKAFYCGAAREVITPPLGTLLYGYNPFTPAESVHDDLTATVLAVGNGEENALLISLTLGDVQTALDAELRQAVSEASGVPFDHIILTATHTHCGPNTSGVEGWGEIDRKFVDTILLPALKKASKDAVSSMTEAEVGYAVGHSEVGINRRQQNPDGSVSLGQNPWGSYDPNMTVMVFRRADDKKGILNLIHYGCHGTACGCAHEITRDWSGMMIDRTEMLTGTMTVFFNGTIGDVGPRLTNGWTTGNITYVEELGSYAAQDAMRIYRNVRDFNVPDVKLHIGTVHLPYQKFPSLDAVRAELAGIKDPEKLYNLQKLRWQHLVDVEKLLAAGNDALPEAFSYPQTLLSIGSTVFIPFPFEHFSEISMRLRAYTGYQNTLTLSCANGYNGYLPTEDQLCRGGYEVGVFRYASVYSLADNTDQHIINENLRILRDNT